MSIEQIRKIEELAVNALPAAVVQMLDGWRLRYNEGVTRRANSVWPNHNEARQPLAEKLRAVEEFYTRYRLPARYQICPAAEPAELDTILAERGYRLDAPTCVQTASLSSVMVQTFPQRDFQVTMTDRLEEHWFETYCQARQLSAQDAPGQRGILQRIGLRTGFALLQVEGQEVALGLGVLEQGWVGIFDMTTRPEWRRQGAAAAVLHALARWGHQHAATQMYLQVMEDNSGALSLYQGAGFDTLYHYHFRTAPRVPGLR